MNITIIADPILTVPPPGYGGIERVVAILCGSLVDKGHRVTLVAAHGSKEFGRLIKHRAPRNTSFISRAYRKLLFQPISLGASIRADVVHNFGRIDYLWALLKTPVPLVHTFENPITDLEVRLIGDRRRRHTTLVSISDHQRQAFNDRAEWQTVYNPIDVGRMHFSPEPRSPPYLAFLGRLTENKGVHVAIEVAKKSGLPLKIAGNVSREAGATEYFEKRIKPELCDQIEWVGEINDEQKVPFLGGAVAFLFPIQWDEPFGIVVGEALACGTPVVALRRASTPETVRDGRTGFLCDSVEEMVAAVKKTDMIRRTECRAFAEKAWAPDVIADRYLSIYEQTINRP